MSKRQKTDPAKLINSLSKDFHDLVSNKQALCIAVENFFNNVVDEMTLGVIFDIHRKYKTNAYDLDVEDSGDDNDSGEGDVFAKYNLKKAQKCMCPNPNCGRAVAPTRFAKHLEDCMGIGRKSSRTASRRVAATSADRDSSSYGGGTPSDDDDDVDWNSGDRRKKKKDKNGSKKNRGTPKKAMEVCPVEPVTVDIEGDDDDLTNLRDILHLQDHSNSTSPADSASSSGSTKKKDKSRSKKNGKRDRSSPSLNISME